jgi:RNA polymerase sigma-70 factor (ECF subfamily)
MTVVRSIIDDHRLAGLMKAVQDGDGNAYRLLLADLVPKLRSLIRRRRPFLQPEDVEDLVQDVLLSLHAVRMTYDAERPFMPWLLAIMHNRMADGARRYARRGANEVAVPEIDVTFRDDDKNVYGDPQSLRRAVAALPAAQQKAIEMVKLGELSLKEAAVRSGMSVGALKVAIHRGMATLRKLLAKEQSR